MWLLLVLVFFSQASAALGLQPSSKVDRLRLQKKKIVLKSPTSYAKRILSHDDKTGQSIEYDPRPEVIVLEAKSGKLALKWIGYDGKEKTVIYQRPDAIDAVVSASVSKTPSGRYLYVYNIHNLVSSGQQLAGFAVQNFASDVKPAETDNVYVGKMSRNREMNQGHWIRFGIFSTYRPVIEAGKNIEFKLESSSPPGLVECRIHGGALGMKGVGEDMPQELENVLPGYEAWPSGFTVGPVDDLKVMSPAERAKLVLNSLPQFQKLGWMTASALRWYEQNLNRNDFGFVIERARSDLKTGDITTEVFGMIHAIE